MGLSDFFSSRTESKQKTEKKPARREPFLQRLWTDFERSLFGTGGEPDRLYIDTNTDELWGVWGNTKYKIEGGTGALTKFGWDWTPRIQKVGEKGDTDYLDFRQFTTSDTVIRGPDDLPVQPQDYELSFEDQLKNAAATMLSEYGELDPLRKQYFQQNRADITEQIGKMQRAATPIGLSFGGQRLATLQPYSQSIIRGVGERSGLEQGYLDEEEQAIARRGQIGLMPTETMLNLHRSTALPLEQMRYQAGTTETKGATTGTPSGAAIAGDVLGLAGNVVNMVAPFIGPASGATNPISQFSLEDFDPLNR